MADRMSNLDTLKKPRHWQAFFWAMGLAALVFIPYMIVDKGYFLFMGDFNVQQIPFYKLVHEAIRSGDVLWNWNTDLGANLLGSYSFYNITSPFFLLTLPFPTNFVPYLMGPLLILKFSFAALTSYCFIQRFVKDNFYAVIGALLYSFSGWAVYDTFFNHFLEVLVFFPLILIALEELVCENRHGVLALAVAINAIVNYWFFIGEVVFVIIYVVVRMTAPGWKMNWKKFLLLAFEAVVGVMIATVILLPSALAIMGNPRTGEDTILNGWNMWTYWQNRRGIEVLYSMFFPPDLPHAPNAMVGQGAKWSSLSLWLPLVGVSGVFAYVISSKKDWLKRMLLVSLVMALVPAFNHLFVMMNHSYYARWFYMPVLLMCTATAKSLENRRIDYMRGLKWTAIMTVAFAAMIGLTPVYADGKWSIGLEEKPGLFWLYVAFALVCVAITFLLIGFYRKDRQFKRMLGASVSAVSVIFALLFIGMGRPNTVYRENYINNCLEGARNLVLPEEPFARSDFYNATDNLGMFWGLPNIQTFHSIVPVSIMEFYPEVGVKRDVSSKPETKYFALRDLLSVRWFFVGENEEEQNLMPGYTLYSKQMGFNIYENQNYLPMGFAYDKYMTREQFESISTDLRSRYLLKMVVLEDEDIEKYSDILTQATASDLGYLNEDDVANLIQERKTMTADYFAKDNYGFESRTSFDKERVVFYSVPYDRGWSVTVNGEPAEVVKLSIGFMGVRVPAGDAVIRFNYMPPGLKIGAVVSAAGVLLLLLYIGGWFVIRRVKEHRHYLEEELRRTKELGGQISLEDYLHSEQRQMDAVLKKQGPSLLDQIENTPPGDDPLFFQLEQLAKENETARSQQEEKPGPEGESNLNKEQTKE